MRPPHRDSRTRTVEAYPVDPPAALDFANTVYRRLPELGADLLTNADALGTWLLRAHLLPAGGDPADFVTGAALHETRALRALLWEVFDAQKDGKTIPTDAFTGLLDTARRGSAHVTVSPDGSMTSPDADGTLAILALKARGRRRRWCSMKSCGNQAKAARYRSTRSADGYPSTGHGGS